MVDTTDTAEARKRKREKLLIVGVTLFLVLATYFEYRLSSLSSRLPFVNSIFFFGLINFNIILLMILVLLISRNIGKIFLERRRQVLGSRLKTKLVLSFLSLTIIPTVTLFLISSFYINSSFDKWFSIKIQNTLQTSLDITETYYKNTGKVAQYLASQISQDLSKIHEYSALQKHLESVRKGASVDGIELYLDPLEDRKYIVTSEVSQNEIPRLPQDIIRKVFSGQSSHFVQHVKGADLIRAAAPIKTPGSGKRGAIAVTFVIPVDLVARVDSITSVFEDYKNVNPLKYPVKTTYFLILVMMTALILFVSIWIGLYLARELTVPLERLVMATQKISQGDLDFQILNTGRDEIARVTESFNQMTSELKRHRKELEEKRTYVETILNSVTAGVISVDERGFVTTMNPSSMALLGLKDSVIGKSIQDISKDASGVLKEAFRLVQSQQMKAPFQKQISLGEDEGYRALSMTVAPADGGAVFVIDDSSYMAKVQREAAWREVARRVAHEIKNPLTPIKLSAQRLSKRFINMMGDDGALIQECTNTIIKNVDELRDMVNEFSSFARFPSANPRPDDLNTAVREVVQLYEAAHKQISFECFLDKNIPTMNFDREQLKRVLINLFDNAVAALSNINSGRISLRTSYNRDLSLASIEVIDNGAGMTEQTLNRLFEPYFSTKKTGTGLGLSIVKRIVNDHGGFIRAHSVFGQGSKFIVELPLHSAPQ